MNITANNTDTLHVVVGWTLQGGGAITGSGSTNANATYTPPPTMPSNSAVTITAYLTTLPALTTSYTLNLINPVPTVTSTSPVHLRAGGTQTVTLTGSGFVPGTTVTMNGTTYPTKYVSYNSATVAITLPGNATGRDTLQVANPAPGGGAGTTFTMSLKPESVTVTATNADGSANNGTLTLGSTLAMSGMEIGSVNTAITWSVVGAGSISNTGLYTAPSVMPTNTVVSIVAALASNPAVTATYALKLINPVPEITSLSPDIIPAGLTSKVTVLGTGFVPSTVILVDGEAVPVTYQSSTSLVAKVAVGVGGSSNFHVQASTTSYTGGVSQLVNLAISTPVSATAAARILDQTTFGPTTGLIQQVEHEGATPWLTQQFNTPQTVLPIVSQPPPLYCGGTEGTAIWCVDSEWWQTAITGNDQLRQRVAFSLSELFVASADVVEGWEMDAYMNMLAADAFTNWYTIMNDVTLSPAMGEYLNLLNSGAPTGTLIANENYARENMQLFNLGLDLLNQDGSLQLDGNGNPIPAYTEAQVQAFARAYTGWTFANPDGSAPNAFTWTANYYDPLVPVESQHDENPKTLLNGTTLPAGQTAEQDMAGALTNIFQHPNVPPFVCKQLIQHLVRSDPYPVYISRCANVFINNGNGVRGDMQAVLTEILTDPEARDGDNGPQPSDGHLREPILWMTAAMRGLGYVNVDPNNDWQNLDNYMDTVNERPLWQPSVFNFYPPSYVIPGTTLNAPEFGLENTASVMDRLTLADNLTSNNITSFNVDLSATSPLGLLASNPAALVNQLGLIFMDNEMDPNLSTTIINAITPLTKPADRVQMATYLVLTSSEYKVLH